MNTLNSRVYILTDTQGRVTRLEGEYTLPTDLSGWVLIDEGAPCDKLNLAQSHYLPKPLHTEDGVFRYKLVDGTVIERSEEEIKADIPEKPMPPKTNAELEEENKALKEQLASLTDTVDTLVLDALGGDDNV